MLNYSNAQMINYQVFIMTTKAMRIYFCLQYGFVLYNRARLYFIRLDSETVVTTVQSFHDPIPLRGCDSRIKTVHYWVPEVNVPPWVVYVDHVTALVPSHP